MKEYNSKIRTPLDTVLTTLYIIRERIPQEDDAVNALNQAIKTISRGFLYDGVDVDDDEEETPFSNTNTVK